MYLLVETNENNPQTSLKSVPIDTTEMNHPLSSLALKDKIDTK